MKEKTWWSNNSLAVMVAILGFCIFTVGGIYLFKSVVGSITEGIKNSPEPGYRGLKIGPKKVYKEADSQPPSTSRTAQNSPFGPYMTNLPNTD